MADHTGGRITASRTTVTPEQFGATSSLNTFSINISRLVLTEVEQAEAKTCISHLQALKQKSVIRKAAEKRGPFHFMALPAELRVRCYGFVLGDNQDSGERLDLATVVIPSIARVSRSVRTEFLPVFFAQSSFCITVAADLRNHANVRAGLPPSNNLALHDRCGVLKMKKQVKNIIRQMSKDVLVRDITLKICDGELWTFPKGRTLPTYRLILEVSLKVERGKATVDTVENKNMPRHISLVAPRSEEEAKIIVEAAGAVANKISEREGFKGFTLNDLEKIVRKFRSGS
ncbi:hypothetical protein Slin15195_G025840 [Septoria linicola]|uniref:Uncharacterized protein n=1 Tax=Septoria linicola TaxID=215465 RepID=A0A9Q9AHN7_9PEZI|nr:hypothetical protein Slin14017_G024910 [Septoria linicola]USW49265.1 hypothetical protein Slin15195_G025840 [Septoria linicola]